MDPIRSCDVLKKDIELFYNICGIQNVITGILIKFGRYFCKFGLYISNFNILGSLEDFDVVESIYTIKNMIQTLLLQEFLIFFFPDSSHLWSSKKFLHLGRQLLSYCSCITTMFFYPENHGNSSNILIKSDRKSW